MSEPTIRVPYLWASVDFVSGASLRVIAKRLSEGLFYGVPFTGWDEGICDEIPACRLEQKLLGATVILLGGPGAEGGYTLYLDAQLLPPRSADATNWKSVRIDLSEHLRYLLSSMHSIVVCPG